MTVGLLGNLAVVAGIFATGFAVARYGRLTTVRRSLPQRLRFVLDPLALGGPWLLSSTGLVPAVVVDGSVVALGLSVGLWVGYPLVLSRVVDPPSGAAS